MVWFILNIIFVIWYSWWLITGICIENKDYKIWRGYNQWYWKLGNSVVIAIQLVSIVRYIAKG